MTIETSLKQLRDILPIENRQKQLTKALRLTHRLVMHFFFEEGCAPVSGDIPTDLSWQETITQLESAGLIALDRGNIVTAYPFSSVDRGYQITSRYGQTEAVCAFDALAISSMFKVLIRIDTFCRLSNQDITIHQDHDNIESNGTVIAAIDWSAVDSNQSCSASLCSEMLFIGNRELANEWQAIDRSQRDIFSLQEAHAMISAFFLPLITPENNR
jgi:hypothetical protein